MKFLKLITILLIFFEVFPYKNSVHAGNENADTYKVLSTNNKKLSITNVQNYLNAGDDYIKKGDFDKAKDSYLDAKLATQLASFILI